MARRTNLPIATHRRIALGHPLALRGVGVLAALAFAWSPPLALADISGRVVDPDGNPIDDAHVKIQRADDICLVAASEGTTTSATGEFSIAASPVFQGGTASISLGRTGYFTVGGLIDADAAGVEIQLDPVPPQDNVHYSWIPPTVPAGSEDLSCGLCHGDQVRQWQDSRHAIAATDPWVLNMYLGTDQAGNEGVAPGFRLDNPDEAGPCANCHAATQAVEAPNETRLDEVTGVSTFGVFCETCHKIRNVSVGPRAGVDGAIQFWRPPSSTTLFAFGPYDDVTPGTMTTSYSPLMRQARLCSACHEWKNDHDVPVMETYTEWSTTVVPGEQVLHCQDCHMASGSDFALPEETPASCPSEVDNQLCGYVLNNLHQLSMSGQRRDPATISRHYFRGAEDEYLTQAAQAELTAEQVGAVLRVKVDVTNLYAGHALPTGMPFRNMVLLVTATDAAGQTLALAAGPRVPDFGGAGDPAQGYFAGQPGRGYAKVLGDGTGERNVPFWRATEVIEDLRLWPYETDSSFYDFTLPEVQGRVTVAARLIYRRAFKELAVAKGWDLEDVLMLEKTTQVDTVAVEPPPAAGGCVCTLSSRRSATERTTGSSVLAVLVGFAGFVLRRRTR